MSSHQSVTENKSLSTTQSLVCFISGMAAVVMGYSVYSHLKSAQQYNVRPKRLHSLNDKKLEDSIKLKSLAYLSHSLNVNMKASAIKIILDRAMTVDHLPLLLAACDKSQPIELRSKAIPSLQLLTRREDNKLILLQAGALPVLVDALNCEDPEMKEVTQRYAAVSICDLIQGNDSYKYDLIKLGILKSIVRILTSNNIRNNDLKYWILMILNQITLTDPIPRELLDNQYIVLLAKMARTTFGNTNMPKFCLQSLVRITSNVESEESKKILEELLHHDIIDLIGMCLKGDDGELIYWAAGLMHEFVMQNIASDQFREIKGIHAILMGLLSVDEIYISRVALRVIKFMSSGQSSGQIKFRQEIVRIGMVKKIMHCLSMDDDGIKYRVVLCINAIAVQAESHHDILSSPEFETLIDLTISTRVKVSIYIANILSSICCTTYNSKAIEPHIDSIINTLNALLLEGDSDVQYNAAIAVFNLMTMTFSFANKVRETCFKSLLDLCTSSRQEKVQLTCAKGALMVVIKNRYLITQLNQKVTETLIDTVNTLSQQVLNIVMSQILMYKLKSDRWNITSSSDQPEKDASKIYEKEDVEVEKFTMNELPPHSNHLSINDEEGEMEHISALESISRELQLLSEHTEMNSPQQMMDGPTPLIESSTLNQNTSQGSLEIDIPVAVRDQLLGCLTALRIFLENDEFISNLISMNNYRMPTMEDLVNSNGTSDVAKSSIYHHMNYVTSHIESDFYPCDDLPPSLLTPVIPFLSLTKPLKLLITHLVYIILGSTMSAFASNNANNYSVETLDKLQYINVYQDVMKWISSQTHLPPDQLYEDIYETSDDEYSDSSSIDEDAAGTISYHINKSSFSISALSCLPSDSNKDTQAESSENQKPTSSKGISVHYEYQKGEGDMLEEIEENQEPTALNSLKSNPEFSCKALILLNALIAYAPAKKYMIEELNVISVLVYILEHHEDLLENATMCLAGLVGDDMNTEIPEESFKKMVILLWLEMRASLPPSTCFMFYSQLTLGWCSRMVSNKNRKFLTTDHRSSQRATLISNHPAFAEIDLVTRSKYCQINYETRLQVRNDSWTFETVRCTHCVPPLSEDNQNDPQKYAFEIVLESYGLMQVGWVTEDFVFDPEGGKGVGDDSESYGYDGKRAKKWHGKNSTVRASYGMIWEIDDTITCAIDMREGEIRYYKNGNDMGIAFSKVSRTRAWYPAISLATGQQCSFLFGSSIDSLRHLPDGYTPIGMITHKSCTNIELPPPPPMDNPIDLYTSILSDENDTSMRSTVDNEISSSNEAYQNRDSTEPNLKPVEPDANDRYLTSIDSREHLFTVQKASIQDQYTLPSMYYEVTIGFIHKENEGFDLSASESLIILGLQSLIPQTSLYFEFDRANKVCRFVLGSERSESFSLDIKDGSTVGILYSAKYNMVGLVINGSVAELVQLHKHTKTKPYLPFVNGCMRSRINFGEVPYIWKLADSLPSKLHMSNYLNRLIGTKKSSQAK